MTSEDVLYSFYGSCVRLTGDYVEFKTSKSIDLWEYNLHKGEIWTRRAILRTLGLLGQKQWFTNEHLIQLLDLAHLLDIKKI